MAKLNVRVARKVRKLAHITSQFLAFFRMMLKGVFLTTLTPVLWIGFDVDLIYSVIICFLLYIITGGWEFIRILILTGPRDVSAFIKLLKFKFEGKKYVKQHKTIGALFKEVVSRHPQKPAFQYEDQSWSFIKVEDYSNSVANYFYERGLRKGDVVALFAESRPEFVCLWLGLSKIGVVTALINFNLRQTPLIHSIKVSEANTLIFGSELNNAVQEIASELPKGIQCYSTGSEKSEVIQNVYIDEALRNAPIGPPPKVPQSFTDKLFYIYTSGTTGLPKAAVITHVRFHFMASGIGALFNMTPDDVIYNTLPLYHSAGGILGVGQTLLQGTTVVIRRKFSASNFWADCVRYNCTVAQYIGEICRYLLSQPERAEEREHRVRLVFGNGMRPQVWQAFTDRFRIRRVGEFYGATEGNANLANTTNHVGAVGFLTRIAPIFYPVSLIKVDEGTGEPVRDPRGLCIQCQPGEPGELVGKIVKNDPVRDFDGYVNKAASSKKVIRDVFSKGDQAFVTGDMLVMDDLGYLYFKDRTGDTFRWRGENVSTSEVEGVLQTVVNLHDVVVYGVGVPGVEGKAGMAAIVDTDDSIGVVDNGLYTRIRRSLPAYAIPMFIRLVREAEMTGTFKLKKLKLVKEGFNPQEIKDKLYMLDARAGGYVPLTSEVYEDLTSGKIRL